MPVSQPVVPIISLPKLVLFPRALLSINLDNHWRDERFQVAAGEWFAEGAIWGLVLARDNARTAAANGRFTRPYRTLGVGCIVHREFRENALHRLVFEGIARGRMVDEFPVGLAASVRIELLHDCVRTDGPHRKELSAAFAEMVGVARQVAAAEPQLGDKIRDVLARHPHPGVVADLLAHACVRDLYAKQCILEELNVCRRVRMVRIQLAYLLAGQSPHQPHRSR
jgi:hypothetical protein